MGKPCRSKQWDDESRRVWSLWDIMNSFDNHSIVHELGMMCGALCNLTSRKMAGDGGGGIDEQDVDLIFGGIERLRSIFFACGLADCVDACDEVRNGMRRPYLDVSTAHALLISLRNDIEKDFKNRKFLYVANTLSASIDHSALFGDLVRSQFPSAAHDIQEAGNCLAAECCTAAVFHLMRAAEFGLHALARDRDVQFPDRPLEEKEWGQILPNLESRVTELGGSARSNWADPQIRDMQIRFYSEVIQELRGFNYAFRRYISHADSSAFYNRESAAGIMAHVKAFMGKLATKISETEVTEKYWK